MAFQAKSDHQFAFYAGTTGWTTTDFVVNVFTVNGAAVDTATSNSFAVTELGGGFYWAKYTPSVAGFYIIAISSVDTAFHWADACDIDDADAAVNLTQDTPTTGALKPTLPVVHPGLGTTLDNYVLMVIDSKDWEVGRTDTSHAIASTRLDIHGNWLATPLTVPPGTYHIVIRNNFGVVKVIYAYLTV